MFTEARLREVFNTLEQHVERRYGIPIIIRDVPSPFTGDLDGAEIHVDYAEDIESALFIIAHLFEACRYSMQLFHEAGVLDLDQWLSDYSSCDFAYLKHFYTTGEKLLFKHFWVNGSPLLQPKPIPPFHPTKWVSRWEGIVV